MKARGHDLRASAVTVRLFPSERGPMVRLTAEIEQVGEEEGLFVEVLDGHHYGPIQTAAEGLLRPALVCDE